MKKTTKPENSMFKYTKKNQEEDKQKKPDCNIGDIVWVEFKNAYVLTQITRIEEKISNGGNYLYRDYYITIDDTEIKVTYEVNIICNVEQSIDYFTSNEFMTNVLKTTKITPSDTRDFLKNLSNK